MIELDEVIMGMQTAFPMDDEDMVIFEDEMEASNLGGGGK